MDWYEIARLTAHWIGLVLAIIIVVILTFWIATFVRTHGTVTDRISAVFRNSVTIAVNRLSLVLTLTVTALSQIAADPTIQSAMYAILEPKYLIPYIIVMNLVSEWARRRGQNTDNDDSNLNN